MDTERNDSQARRVLLVLLTFLAVGGVGVAAGAVIASNNDDGDDGEAVEVRSQAAEAKADESQAADESEADKPAKTSQPKPAKPAATPAPTAPASSGSQTTTFACKADVGEDAPGCGTVYDSGGLRVEANCDPSGLAALATVPHAVMTAEVTDSGGESFGSITDSTVDRGFALAPQDTPASRGAVTFTAPDSGQVIVLEFSATVVPGSPQGDCVFVGKVSER